MTVNKTYKGGCDCGNIKLKMELSASPKSYNPRICDCDCCQKRGAIYLSDPKVF